MRNRTSDFDFLIESWKFHGSFYFYVSDFFPTPAPVLICSLFGIIFYSIYSRISKGQRTEDGCLGLKDIPGKPPILGIELIGNFLKLLPISNSIKNARDWATEFPGLWKVTGLTFTFVVITTAPLVQQLFKSTAFGHNIKSPIVYDQMKPYITNGLLVSTGKFWQSQRKVMMRTQSFQSLKAYMGLLNKHSKDFVQTLENLFSDGKPHEINETINVIFLKIICEMITGHDTSFSKELCRYHHNFQVWKEAVITKIVHPWYLLPPIWKLHPLSWRHDKAVQEMFDFAKRRIQEHKEQQNNGKNSPERNPTVEQGHFTVDSEKPFRSLLDELLDARIEDDQIIDEVNTMLFGGHETGATAVHFFCFAMALHPDIQAICHQEIDTLFENEENLQNNNITFEAAQTRLKFVEQCIQETLRMFHPVFMFVRRLESSLKLEHENKTFLLPAGTHVGIAPLATHYNPEYYPHPETFDPDRFSSEEVAKRQASSFISFSGGPRSCLGMKFAMLEMKVVVAYILRHFTISTKHGKDEIPLLPYITTTPAKDYTFKFERRLMRQTSC